MLPAADIAFLESKSLTYRATSEGGIICVMLPAFALPAGLSLSQADLLLRLSPGYPDVPPDMWWFTPAVCVSACKFDPLSGVIGVQY